MNEFARLQMFGAEPQEKWTSEEAKEFEQYVAVQHRRTRRNAQWAGSCFLLNILLIVPFLYGHSLHSHWESFGKYLLLTAMASFLWFVIKAGFVWSSWQSARETRRVW
jgi:protein-S-isoprenylcysteine O-methyltransferase Ste14